MGRLNLYRCDHYEEDSVEPCPRWVEFDGKRAPEDWYAPHGKHETLCPAHAPDDHAKRQLEAAVERWWAHRHDYEKEQGNQWERRNPKPRIEDFTGEKP